MSAPSRRRNSERLQRAHEPAEQEEERAAPDERRGRSEKREASPASVLWKREALRSSHGAEPAAAEATDAAVQPVGDAAVRRGERPAERDRRSVRPPSASSSQGSPPRPIVAREARSSVRPGEQRRRGQEQPLRQDHEELAGHGRDDRRARAAARSGVFSRYGCIDSLTMRARGQPEEQPSVARRTPSRDSRLGAGGSLAPTAARRPAASARHGEQVRQQQQGQPPAQRVHEGERAAEVGVPQARRPAGRPPAAAGKTRAARRSARCIGQPDGVYSIRRQRARSGASLLCTVDMHTLDARRRPISDAQGDGLFDPDFLSELEGLVAESGTAVAIAAPGAAALSGLARGAGAFLRPAGARTARRSTKPAFLALRPSAVSERCNGAHRVLPPQPAPRARRRRSRASSCSSRRWCRPSSEDHSYGVRTTFFRLVPTLVQMAWDDSEPAPTGGGTAARRSRCSSRSCSRSRASSWRPRRATCSSRASTSSRA